MLLHQEVANGGVRSPVRAGPSPALRALAFVPTASVNGRNRQPSGAWGELMLERLSLHSAQMARIDRMICITLIRFDVQCGEKKRRTERVPPPSCLQAAYK